MDAHQREIGAGVALLDLVRDTDKRAAHVFLVEYDLPCGDLHFCGSFLASPDRVKGALS
ncbi:MAG: hypothetical protein NVSMB51_21600 [Solirubrobacteraceae bacterium]